MGTNVYSEEELKNLTPLKAFSFISHTIIEADTMEEAKEKFADNSMNFAADADCQEIEQNIIEQLEKTKSSTNEDEYVCKECGSNDVHQLEWRHANTKVFIDNSPGEKNDNWCVPCGKHVEFITKKEFTNNS